MAGGERHSSRLFKYRGCAIRSVCCPARVSERANDWADQRINVGGLGWLIASWFDCRPPLLSPKLAYCTLPWQYTLVTCTQILLACTGECVPVHDTISPFAMSRRVPPFLRNKRTARSHDATALSLSLSLSLPFSLSLLLSLETIIVNYCERKEKIAPIIIFYEPFLTSH